jgi:hypothetical protein
VRPSTDELSNSSGHEDPSNGRSAGGRSSVRELIIKAAGWLLGVLLLSILGLLASGLGARAQRGWLIGATIALIAALGTIVLGKDRGPRFWIINWYRGTSGLFLTAAISLLLVAVIIKSPKHCEPGYKPCLPIVHDLNCSQITVPKPITVIGRDRYQLDRDGDGLACE